MNNFDIGVWSMGRVSSKRCPKKMIRPFGDSTLTDICLNKLTKLDVDVYFSGYEDIFKDKCQKHGVTYVPRTKRSANIDEPASEILEFILDIDNEYLLMVNACLPFLKIETIQNFINICKKGREPSFAVIKKPNYYVTTEGKPLNFPDNIKTINTKAVEPVYEFAHALYFFKKEHFMNTGWFWDWEKVRYVEIPHGIETFDIHTEGEFLMAEALWKNNEFRKGCFEK